MTWLHRFRVRHYLRNSIWFWPAVAIVLALATIRGLHALEESMDWRANVDPETARTVLGALAGAMFTFVVFVCSSLLLVVQLASAQLTPRVIGTMFRDHVVKLTLAVFVFSFTFVLAAMIRIGSTVPLLITHAAAYGCIVSIGLFLFLIDHVGKMLRPSGVLEAVASEAHAVIEHVYPRRMSDPPQPSADLAGLTSRQSIRSVASLSSGVVMAVDLDGLVRLASRHDCIVELVPQVGDFVAPGDVLYRVHGGTHDLTRDLRHSIALGAERTVEQDPMFAFRMIVDIASKGLSPAINDPTTAVLAIDRVHHLLRHVGQRRLDSERIRDVAGRVRLIYPTPDWDNYLSLAVTEIRQFGGGSIQVVRRLRAMLEDLLRALPEERLAPLRLELQRLKMSSERLFQDPEDRALAAESDVQGMGGHGVDGRLAGAAAGEVQRP